MPFAQTTRSLDADTGTVTLIGVAVFGLLLALILLWAFAARFMVYATSEPTKILLGETIVAHFPTEEGERLQVGQPALIYLDESTVSGVQTLQGQVFDVMATANGVEAEVVPDIEWIDDNDPAILDLFYTPVSGHVDVQVEAISPATLLLRTTGLLADTPPLISTPR